MVGRFIENDISAIFRQTAFAETVVLDGVTISQAIFDDADRVVEEGEGVGQIVPTPMLQVPTHFLCAISDGSVVIVRGKTYRVANWKNDGTGVTEILLEGPSD